MWKENIVEQETLCVGEMTRHSGKQELMRMPQYRRNIAKVGIKHQSINQLNKKIYVEGYLPADMKYMKLD